jgi:hypothetical protein
MGPAFISVGWRSEEPELVARHGEPQAPERPSAPVMALVDRTCLGVKGGALLRR